MTIEKKILEKIKEYSKLFDSLNEDLNEWEKDDIEYLHIVDKMELISFVIDDLEWLLK